MGLYFLEEVREGEGVVVGVLVEVCEEHAGDEAGVCPAVNGVEEVGEDYKGCCWLYVSYYSNHVDHPSSQ